MQRSLTMLLTVGICISNVVHGQDVVEQQKDWGVTLSTSVYSILGKGRSETTFGGVSNGLGVSLKSGAAYHVNKRYRFVMNGGIRLDHIRHDTRAGTCISNIWFYDRHGFTLVRYRSLRWEVEGRSEFRLSLNRFPMVASIGMLVSSSALFERSYYDRECEEVWLDYEPVRRKPATVKLHFGFGKELRLGEHLLVVELNARVDIINNAMQTLEDADGRYKPSYVFQGLSVRYYH